MHRPRLSKIAHDARLSIVPELRNSLRIKTRPSLLTNLADPWHGGSQAGCGRLQGQSPSLCLVVRRAILVRMGKLDEACPGSCP